MRIRAILLIAREALVSISFEGRANRVCRIMDIALNKTKKKIKIRHHLRKENIKLQSGATILRCAIFLRATRSGVNYSDRSSYQLLAGARRCRFTRQPFLRGRLAGVNLRSPITCRSRVLTCNIHAVAAIF